MWPVREEFVGVSVMNGLNVLMSAWMSVQCSIIALTLCKAKIVRVSCGCRSSLFKQRGTGLHTRPLFEEWGPTQGHWHVDLRGQEASIKAGNASTASRLRANSCNSCSTPRHPYFYLGRRMSNPS